MFSIIFLQAGGGLASMLPFLAMILVLYFFMIRPQMNRQKKEKVFQAGIKKGARVVTSSGIHGKIAEINESDNTVTIRHRDTMEQKRVSIDSLREIIENETSMKKLLKSI